jgi:acyl-CoA thioesterase
VTPTSDADFLGLTATEGERSFRFIVAPHLARLDGRLYGGTAIAVSITAAELVSERSALWMTTQFVSTAPAGAEIDVRAEVLAPGHRTNQVRVTGTNHAGEVMFASLGATGHHRDGGMQGVFENPPEVDLPADAAPRGTPFDLMVGHLDREDLRGSLPAGAGFTSAIEMREPVIRRHPDPGPGRLCVWVRRRDRAPVTPALVAFMADMVPLSISVACGQPAFGMSLDNSIRIGSFEETEWVLVDLRPHLAVGDYGHGAAHIWSERGHLLATASQSATLRPLDGAAGGSASAR